ncbi:MAG: sulfatase-like hydrolase/transferase, partial [Halieaceae bacterium]|nr:sulfatase-like hydrolase/transferase [Halieaceae bacterium]
GLPDVNAPYRGWKSTLFEGGIRVPFLARWPLRLPAGKTYDAPVHHVDIYATAAAAAGAELPTDRIMDGVDLTPYVTANVTANVKDTKRMDSPHEYLFFRGGAAQAVRDKRWKLMVSAPPQLSHKQSGRRPSHAGPGRPPVPSTSTETCPKMISRKTSSPTRRTDLLQLHPQVLFIEFRNLSMTWSYLCLLHRSCNSSAMIRNSMRSTRRGSPSWNQGSRGKAMVFSIAATLKV